MLTAIACFVVLGGPGTVQKKVVPPDRKADAVRVKALSGLAEARRMLEQEKLQDPRYPAPKHPFFRIDPWKLRVPVKPLPPKAWLVGK